MTKAAIRVPSTHKKAYPSPLSIIQIWRMNYQAGGQYDRETWFVIFYYIILKFGLGYLLPLLELPSATEGPCHCEQFLFQIDVMHNPMNLITWLNTIAKWWGNALYGFLFSYIAYLGTFTIAYSDIPPYSILMRLGVEIEQSFFFSFFWHKLFFFSQIKWKKDWAIIQLWKHYDNRFLLGPSVSC